MKNLSTEFLDHIKYLKEACLQCDYSTCGYKVGCLVVKDNKILIKSWNKKLSGNPYCVGDSCYREENNLSGGAEIQKVCSIHAEAYAIAHAAKEGISIKNSTMYVSTHPCIICTRSIVVAGISKVVYMSDYESDQIFTSLYEENNIELIKISENEVWGNQ